MDDLAFLSRDSRDQPHALIAIGSAHHPPTLAAASQIAVSLIDAGFIVDLGNASTKAMPAPPDYDLVVAGATGRLLYDRDLLHWIADYADMLEDTASGAFLLGGSHRSARSITRIVRCGWQPLATTILPDTPRAGDETTELVERFVERVVVSYAVRACANSTGQWAEWTSLPASGRL